MQTLSWSPPFFSSDVPQGESLVYNVLVDGISIINTTDTSIELTNSLANVLCTNFTVSLTASAYVYMSEEKQEVIDNTGSKLLSIFFSFISYQIILFVLIIVQHQILIEQVVHSM